MWTPVLPIYTVLASVLSLLDEPVLDDPLVPEITQTFVENYDRYFENARLYTRKYATGERPDISELIIVRLPRKSDSNPILAGSVLVSGGGAAAALI
jgi:hypothetical protein